MKTTEFQLNNFIAAGQQFFEGLAAELITQQIPVQALKCDHLCFRVGTTEEYSFYKQALLKQGKLLTEAIVNGRAISTFKLHRPFKTTTHEIELVELPAPKTGANYQTGFEHAEFVISEDFSTFRAKHSQLHFTESGNKTLNPELCLKLKNDKQAKFHHLSLERVIEIEEAKIKEIIFDFDGTLINSREHIFEINRQMLSKALDREVSLQESIDKFEADFPKLFEAFGLTDPEKQKQAMAEWGIISDNYVYELFDGALETLTHLKSQGYRLHLWTARDEYSARKILQHHKIEDFFITLSFATTTNSKPHAQSLRFDWTQTHKNQMIVIGDSPTDMNGAKNINAIRGAALWDPYAKKSSLIETGAELFFHKMTDVLESFAAKTL